MSKWHDQDMEIETLKRRIDELEARVPADIGMVQPEDFRGLSPYLRHGGVWGVFEVWTAEPLSGDVALFREADGE